MAGTLFTYGANATGTAAFFAGFDTIAYSPLDYTSPVQLRLSAAGTVDLTNQLLGRSVTFTAAPAGSNAVTTSDGDDMIIGGLDGDTLNGGAGIDTIFSAPEGSDDTANDALMGGSGSDTLIDFGGAMTSISAGAGNDTIRLGGPETLVGSSMGGTINGGADTDRIESVAAGSSGFVAPLRLQNLTLSNVEILDASAGVIATAAQFQSFQTIENAAGRTLTLAAAGSVDIRAKLGSQGVIFIGSDGNDRITLGNGADRIEAGDGDDTLVGRGGPDQLWGGTGKDRVDYLSSPQGVLVDLLSGRGSGGDAQGDTYDSIESVLGSSYDDFFIASAAAEDFDGGPARDTISYERSTAAVTVNLATGIGSGGFSTGDTYKRMQNIFGSRYGDVLTGDDGDNVIHAAAGDYSSPYETDIVRAGGGNDTVRVNGYHPVEAEYYGEGGSDTFYVPTSWLEEVDGSVTVSGGSGNDKFYTVDRAYGRLDGGDDVDDLYIETDDSRAPHGQYRLQISNIEHLYTLGYVASFTAAQFESFDRIAYSPTELSRRVGLRVRYEDGTSVDLAEQLQGRSATVQLMDGIVYVRTSDGDDVVYGGMNATYDTGAGNDDITGSTGDDTLIGGAGADKLKGGNGIDTVSYVTSAAGVRVDLTSLVGTGGDAEGDTYSSIENIIGSTKADTLIGSSAKNRIEGGDGDDVLAGRGGADALIGGDGIDTVSYSTSTLGVRVDLTNRTGTGGEAQGNTYSGIENIIGSSEADTLIGSSIRNRIEAGDGDDVLAGRGGPDELIGGEGTDTVTYGTSAVGVRVDLTNNIGTGGDAEGNTYSSIEDIRGSGQADTLIGTSAKNRIEGASGDDVLAGRGGADELIGGDGSDTVTYGTSAFGVRVDLINNIGTGGDASGNTYSSIENIRGSGNGDTLIGSSLKNRIEGGGGNDVLAGRGGPDVLIGGDGSDTASYGTSAAGVTVNLATNVNSGGDAQGDTLSEIENLTGSNFSDRLTGNSAANRLDGGLGNDTMTGGSGPDTFAFTTAPSTSNIDVITDMTVGSDLISLSTAIYSALQGGPTPGSLAASSFRTTTQASTSGGLGEVIYNATTGSLLYDADGSGAGAAKQFASVSAGLALSANSFRLA